VPGTAGVAALAWSGAAGFGPRGIHVVLALGGALVAVSGFAARVISVEVAGCGLTVRYAARRPFERSWSDLHTLRPPRWPLGGWRVVGDSGSRTLMPSDLLGAESLLDAIVHGASLRFSGREWRRRRPQTEGVSRVA
jgi:hypothetical protein